MTLCLGVAACGGGGGSTNTGTNSNAAQPPAQITSTPVPSVIIDAEGDSLIWGLETINGTQIQTPNSAPVVLQADLQSQLGAQISVRVDNRAMPGATTEDSLYAVMPYYAQTFSARIASAPGQIVLADYAVNDSRVRTTDEYDTDLTQWVANIRAAGKTPVLEEPNPVCAPDVPNLDAYVSIMRTVAQTQNVMLIEQYDYIRSLPNWQSMLTDCIHPNDALYAIKAQREAWALAPVVLSLIN
ncbi:SGNH/GDSL hydrolase family protein [Paraburkholderia xenovorans]